MKKSVILLCSAFILNTFTFLLVAQDKKMNVAEFEKRKMEYIKKEAELTEEECGKYFPLSNELSQKKFELHKQHRDKIQEMKNNNQNMSDEEYRKLLENDMDIRLKETQLDKSYSDKFEKVLSPEKLYRAQQAEKDFMQKEVIKFREERAAKRSR